MNRLKAYWQIVFLQAVLLIIIGLWNLFSGGLPAINHTSLSGIFPAIFPIIFGSIFLFLLPLFKEADRFWLWPLLLLSFLIGIGALQRYIQHNHLSIGFLLIGIISIGVGIYYLLFITFHRH